MDTGIFKAINRLAQRTGWAHGVFRFNANNGIAAFGLLLVIAFLISRQQNDARALAATVWAGAAALVGLALAQAIGRPIDRARPYEVIAHVHLLVDKTTDFSFPSDHATVAGAVAVGLLIANRRWGIVASVLAILMAFTRVYVGAHYPGDVLGGLLLGAIVAWLGDILLVPHLQRVVERLSTTRLRPVVARVSPRT